MKTCEEIVSELNTLTQAIERAAFLKSFNKGFLRKYLRNRTYEERSYHFHHISSILTSLKIPFTESQGIYTVDISSLTNLSIKKFADLHDNIFTLELELNLIVEDMHESYDHSHLIEAFHNKIDVFNKLNQE